MHVQDTDRTAPAAGGARRQRRSIVLALLVGALLAATVLVLGDQWLRNPPPERSTSVASGDVMQAPAAPSAAITPAPATPPTADIDQTGPAAAPLPALADSDDEVRGTLTELLPVTLHPSLAPSSLVARAASLLDSFAHGRVVRDKLPLPTVPGKTVAIERGGQLFLDPANHARYDTLVSALESIDAKALAHWYLRYEPLLQQACTELGNGDIRARTLLLGGIDTMLGAPIAPPQIALVQPAVFYKFADPALESLPDSQKLLLRIGPHNREIVTAWLVGFANQLR